MARSNSQLLLIVMQILPLVLCQSSLLQSASGTIANQLEPLKTNLSNQQPPTDTTNQTTTSAQANLPQQLQPLQSLQQPQQQMQQLLQPNQTPQQQKQASLTQEPQSQANQTQSQAQLPLQPQPQQPPNQNPQGQNEQEELESFKRSLYYVPPFDAKLLSMPKVQREFVREALKKDFEFYKEILHEAIKKKDKFASSLQLTLKYGPKLFARLIKNKHEENRLEERIKYNEKFYLMIGDMVEEVMSRSSELKKERDYKKESIDTDQMERRLDSILNWLLQVANTSPVGVYVKWNETILFRTQDQKTSGESLLNAFSDLYAQFRALGYESTTLVTKRIIKMVRLFSRGLIPALDEI